MSETNDTSGLSGGAVELHRLREMFAQSPSFSALLAGPDHRFVLTNPAYRKLIGHREVIGLTVREAVPKVESQGFVKLLDDFVPRRHGCANSMPTSSVGSSSARRREV